MKSRTSAVKTGSAGILALRNYCASNDLIFQGEPGEDYGVDCYLEVELEHGPSNFIVGVQCKAGPSYRRNKPDGSFDVSVSHDDLAYWSGANIPVVFVYHDIGEQALYWQHVQAVIGGKASLSDIKHLSFTEQDDVRRSSLAEYVRRLVQCTPSTGDRIRLFSAEAACVVNARRYPIVATACDPIGESLPFEGPFYSSVLGYSGDDRWVLIREVVDCGGLPSEIYVMLLDTHEWAALRLPLLVHPEGDEEPDELPRDIAREKEIVKAIQSVGFFRPQVYHLDHAFIHDSDRSAASPQVAFALGSEIFDILVIGRREHRALVLENRRFVPPRRTTILTQPTKPMPYIGDFMGIGESQALLGVCELVASPSGNRVSIGAITNSDHACWGAPAVFHVHLTVEELRQSCIDALLV